MSVQVDKESIMEAYEDVRNDNSETLWLVLTYEGNSIILGATGSDYEEFKSKFTDDERTFGFVRMTTGDELSRRSKFVLINWCGANVSPIKRARMSTDKMEVKMVIQSISIELQVSEHEEIEESNIMDQLIKAGGANYGTGSRD